MWKEAGTRDGAVERWVERDAVCLTKHMWLGFQPIPSHAMRFSRFQSQAHLEPPVGTVGGVEWGEPVH